MSCKYCQIAEKQSPVHILYEDQYVVAFLEENPVSKGHALLIPREHAATFSQLTDVAGFAKGLKEYLRIVEEKLSPDLNIVVNQGRKAGQDIGHFHVHIIPRYEGEKIFEWTWHQLTQREAEEVVNLLKE